MNFIEFLSGFAMAAFLFSSLFFFKFWKASRDRFFLYFGTGTLLLALERIALALIRQFLPTLTPISEGIAWVYLIRLLAYMIILLAILEKNRAGSRT